MENIKIKNRQKVMKFFLDRRGDKTFYKTQEIANFLEVAPIIVRACIYPIKFDLARVGQYLINDFSKGYRIGSFDEFKAEVDKSCKRSIAHMAAMIKLINSLENRLPTDHSQLMDIVVHNVNELKTVYSNEENPPPSIPDFVSELADS